MKITDPSKSALAFWRDEEFHFCCEDEKCYYYRSLEGQDSNQLYLDIISDIHDYKVRLFKDGNWAILTGNLENSHLIFCNQLAKCYSELPSWYTALYMH